MNIMYRNADIFYKEKIYISEIDMQNCIIQSCILGIVNRWNGHWIYWRNHKVVQFGGHFADCNIKHIHIFSFQKYKKDLHAS
jgi:hypothetical protein